MHPSYADKRYSEQHACAALCQAPGICQIETTPQSVEATFTGKHGSFQYTKVKMLDALHLPQLM
jgi:hypothetical protein